jgi:hypothetical protein
MAGIQHQDARRLLGIISSATKSSQLLTYREAAKLLGRVPAQNHSRATAQMCDLLDAATCLAGIPLLALVKVRDESGGINPKAWKDYPRPQREAIIKHSEAHQFLPSDFKAISRALDDLGGGETMRPGITCIGCTPAT